MSRATQKKLVFAAILIFSCFLTASSKTDKGPLINIPSKIKDLGTTIVNPGTSEPLIEISPTATNLGAFTVPSNRVLVITAVMIFPQSPGAGTLKVRLDQNTASRHVWYVPNDVPTQIFYPTGLVIAPDYSLKIYNYGTSSGSIRVHINGYISKNK